MKVGELYKLLAQYEYDDEVTIRMNIDGEMMDACLVVDDGGDLLRCDVLYHGHLPVGVQHH